MTNDEIMHSPESSFCNGDGCLLGIVLWINTCGKEEHWVEGEIELLFHLNTGLC